MTVAFCAVYKYPYLLTYLLVKTVTVFWIWITCRTCWDVSAGMGNHLEGGWGKSFAAAGWDREQVFQHNAPDVNCEHLVLHRHNAYVTHRMWTNMTSCGILRYVAAKTTQHAALHRNTMHGGMNKPVGIFTKLSASSRPPHVRDLSRWPIKISRIPAHCQSLCRLWIYVLHRHNCHNVRIN